MKCMRLNNRSTGFTLVEMLVVAPILILLIGTFIFAIIELTGSAVAERLKATTASDIYSALERIESDVKQSGGFLAKNNFTLTAPQGRNGATEDFLSVSGQPSVLVLNVLATSANPYQSARSLVYKRNTPYPCGDTNFAQNQVMTFNVVYYTKLNTSTNANDLWRRVLAVNNYTNFVCSGATIWQRPSCTPGATGTLCATQDEKLVSGVSDFTLEYFNSPADSTPSPGAQSTTDTARQSALNLTDTVQITLKTAITAAGRDSTQQGTMRATRAGSLVTYGP